MSDHQWSKDEVAAFEAVLQSMDELLKAFAWRHSLQRLRYKMWEMTATDEQKNAPIMWRVGPYIAGVNREN